MLTAVIHIDELEKWPMALGNLRNLAKEQVPLEVVVVVNGGAVKGYVMPEIVAQIAELSRVNCHFEACNNALQSQQLTLADLPDWVAVVPAGIVRLIELQQQGYAYIKP